MRSATPATASDWFADRGTATALAAACAKAGAVPLGVTCSVGDAVTYRVTDVPDCRQLTGHRRFLEARFVLRGVLRLEVAQVSFLDPLDEYSDLTDRQHFAGSSSPYTVPAGTLVLIERDEAVRDVRLDGLMLVLRVSVEAL